MIQCWRGISYSQKGMHTSEANMDFKRLIYKIIGQTVQRPLARATRGMTLGARVMVIDDKNEVLLVRHTYSPGWILPGGGVERGETLKVAALREIREEAGIIGETLVYHGIFSNELVFPGDHVACYVVRQFTREDWTPNGEIAAAKFFSVNHLPDDVTGGTKRRLDEIFHGAPISEMW
jgi:8-oxo-dGTP pyrophosphatase MutT (NUDIX family)